MNKSQEKKYSFATTTPPEWHQLCAEFSARGVDIKVEIPTIGGTFNDDGDPQISHWSFDEPTISELHGTSAKSFRWNAKFTVRDLEDSLMIEAEKRVEYTRNTWLNQQENSAKLTTKLKGLLVADTQNGGE